MSNNPPELPVRSYRSSRSDKGSPRRPAPPVLPARRYQWKEPVKLTPSSVRSSTGSRRDLIRRSPSNRPKAPAVTTNNTGTNGSLKPLFTREPSGRSQSSSTYNGHSRRRMQSRESERSIGRYRSAEIGMDILSETLSAGSGSTAPGGMPKGVDVRRSMPSQSSRKSYSAKHSTSRSSASSRPAAPTLRPPRAIGSSVKLCTAIYDYTSQYEDTFSFSSGQVFAIVNDGGDWWKVRKCDTTTRQPFGETKLIPCNYIERLVPIPPDPDPAPLPPKPTPTQHQQAGVHSHARTTSSSASSLPPLGDSGLATKKEKKRMSGISRFYLSILELVASEYKYVLDLTIINDCFVQMLMDRGKTELSRRIFSVWENMLVVHDQVFHELLQSLPSHEVLKRTLGVLPSSTQPRIQSLGSSGQTKLTIDFEADGARLKVMEQLHIATFNAPPPLANQSFWIQTLSEWATKACKVMLRMSDYLKACIPYIANYQAALDVLEDLATSDPKTLRVINEAESQLEGLHLRDYLIKPVQRVCKYPLLLREIERRCFDDQVKAAAIDAKHKLEDVADRVNEMVKLHEKGGLIELLHNVRELFRPRSLLHSLGLDKHLFEPTTKLYRKGTVGVVTAAGVTLAKGEYELFLLTEFLLFTDSYMNYFKQKERLNIKCAMKFNQVKSVVRVRDAYENKAFKLNGPGVELTCVCSSNLIRDGWIDDIQRAFKAFHDSEARKRAVEASKRHLSVGDVSPIKIEAKVEHPTPPAQRKPSFTFDAKDSNNPGIANAMLLAREFKSLQRRRKA